MPPLRYALPLFQRLMPRYVALPHYPDYFRYAAIFACCYYAAITLPPALATFFYADIFATCR